MSADDRSTKEQQGKLTGLLRCLQAFQQHDRAMPTSMANTFLLVALNEGKSMREYRNIARVPESTMSRHLLDLGDRNRQMGPGLGLIERRRVPTNLRANKYTLTPKGRTLLSKLVHAVSA
jgi:DNA-binding MarR family transcriptional regulator